MNTLIPNPSTIKERLSQEILLEAMGRARANPNRRETLSHIVHPGTSKARQFSISIGYLTMEIDFNYWIRNNSLDKYISTAIIGKMPNAYPDEGLNPLYIHPNDLQDFSKNWSVNLDKLIRLQNQPELYKKEYEKRAKENQKVEYYYFILTSLTTGLNYLIIAPTQTAVRADFTAFKTYIERSFTAIDERQSVATGGMDEMERAMQEIDLRLKAYKDGYIEKMRSLPMFSLQRINMVILQTSVFRDVERQAEEAKAKVRGDKARFSRGKFDSANEFRNQIRAKVMVLSSIPKGTPKVFQIAGVKIVYLHAGEGGNGGAVGRLGFVAPSGELIADVPTNDTKLTVEQEPVAYKTATDKVFENIKKRAK